MRAAAAVVAAVGTGWHLHVPAAAVAAVCSPADFASASARGAVADRQPYWPGSSSRPDS